MYLQDTKPRIYHLIVNEKNSCFPGCFSLNIVSVVDKARVHFLCTSVPEKFLAVWKETPARVLVKWQRLWCCHETSTWSYLAIHPLGLPDPMESQNFPDGRDLPWSAARGVLECRNCTSNSSLPPHIPVRNMSLVRGSSEFPFEPQPLPKANTALKIYSGCICFWNPAVDLTHPFIRIKIIFFSS